MNTRTARKRAASSPASSVDSNPGKLTDHDLSVVLRVLTGSPTVPAVGAELRDDASRTGFPTQVN